MSANNLLIWMSARGEGSWQQFRAAVEEFHIDSPSKEEDDENADDQGTGDLPLYQKIRLGFQSLAHAEFFSTNANKDWRVVPPVLAVVKHLDSHVGILCGARSPKMYELLKSLNNDILFDEHKIPGMPDRFRMITSEIKRLHVAATAMGFVLQENAPVALLAAIPPVDDPRSRKISAAPAGPGWIIERFLPSNLRWSEIEQGELEKVQTGLFRFRLRYQRFHYLRLRGKTFDVQGQVGKYTILKHAKIKRLLLYDTQRSLLTIPTMCRPPLLIERALVLCSGLLPSLNRATGRLEYVDVSKDVAQLAAQLLRQEI